MSRRWLVITGAALAAVPLLARPASRPPRPRAAPRAWAPVWTTTKYTIIMEGRSYVVQTSILPITPPPPVPPKPTPTPTPAPPALYRPSPVDPSEEADPIPLAWATALPGMVETQPFMAAGGQPMALQVTLTPNPPGGTANSTLAGPMIVAGQSLWLSIVAVAVTNTPPAAPTARRRRR